LPIASIVMTETEICDLLAGFSHVSTEPGTRMGMTCESEFVASRGR
jgi:hypothetical protein